jgi:NAD(P)-dependent dehydrogenase (short-subunit alcohol dehydrogenase family)
MSKILITGTSQGIGFELLCQFLIDQSHEVIAIARKPLDQSIPVFNQAIKEHRLFPFELDLVKDDFYPLSNTLNTMNGVDIVINNAGFLVNKPFVEQSEEDWQNQFDVNVFSPARLIRFLYPWLLLSRNAHIVNITSMGGFQGSSKFPGLSAYSASKAALGTLTECLAVEFSGKGISVNALALGAVQTEMLSQAFPGYEAPISAQKMADFISNFALNGHQYFNGKQIPVAFTTP